MRKSIGLLIGCLLLPGALYAQILISLLFGEKLNSDKIEFGLDGGLCFPNSDDNLFSDNRRNFNLGFYFDFKLSEKAKLHTGVMVKSPMGSNNVGVYSLNNSNLDSLFLDGNVERKLSYFNIPISMKYFVWDYFFVELGPQIGILNGASDEFSNTLNGDILTYDNKIKDEINFFDVGITAGLGYKLLKGEGINLGLRYYSGLVNYNKNGSFITDGRNSNFYIFAGIPIKGVKANKN